MKINNYENFDINNVNINVCFKNKGLGLFLITLTEGNEDVKMPCVDENGYMNVSLKSLFDVYKLLITKEFGSSVEEIIYPTIFLDYNDSKTRFDISNTIILTNLNDNLKKAISHFPFYQDPGENEYISIAMNELFELFKLKLYINDKSTINDVINGEILIDKEYLIENKLSTFKRS